MYDDFITKREITKAYIFFCVKSWFRYNLSMDATAHSGVIICHKCSVKLGIARVCQVQSFLWIKMVSVCLRSRTHVV